MLSLLEVLLATLLINGLFVSLLAAQTQSWQLALLAQQYHAAHNLAQDWNEALRVGLTKQTTWQQQCQQQLKQAQCRWQNKKIIITWQAHEQTYTIKRASYAVRHKLN